jgi:protein-S-isoprenylcysteine O-methyltransferase
VTCRWSRHPSYAGFFYWALGTQLVLQNPLSFGVYFVLLMRFFSARIKGASLLLRTWYFILRIIAAEERALVNFFGDDYVSYRNEIGTGIPFIP